MFRLTDHTAHADTVPTMDELIDAAREIAPELRRQTAQAWTTMHFQRLDNDGNVTGEGSVNAEMDAWPRVVWYWQD